jgi:hypothetical protein
MQIRHEQESIRRLAAKNDLQNHARWPESFGGLHSKHEKPHYTFGNS